MDAAEIDKELDELETKAEQLRALYEQYFMGLERLEPAVLRRDVEKRIKLLRREQIRNTAQRFKFNTLVQRYSTMQQYWARIVREIENGTYRRDVMRAAARFGADGVLGALGKKKLAAAALTAAAKAEASRTPEDESLELGADDLIEEAEDEPQTPPRLEPAAAAGAPLAASPVPAEAPKPEAARPRPVGGLSALAFGAKPAPAKVEPTKVDAAPPSVRPAGLRWGSSAPSDATKAAPDDVKRKVAELAAQLSARRPGPGPARDPEPPAAPAPAVRSTAGPTGVAARPAPAQATAVKPASAAALPAPAPAAPPAVAGFGVLDIPFGPDAPPAPQPSPPRTSPAAVPAAPARPAARPVAPAAGPSPAKPAAPAAPAPPADLGEQRIRQIYAKYVETKRATQESTAGVTYEKLAASLRAQAEKLRSAHPNKSIDYEVVVKDGKTHLKPILR